MASFGLFNVGFEPTFNFLKRLRLKPIKLCRLDAYLGCKLGFFVLCGFFRVECTLTWKGVRVLQANICFNKHIRIFNNLFPSDPGARVYSKWREKITWYWKMISIINSGVKKANKVLLYIWFVQLKSFMWHTISSAVCV